MVREVGKCFVKPPHSSKPQARFYAQYPRGKFDSRERSRPNGFLQAAYPAISRSMIVELYGYM
jgi:hypothetical protein